MAHTKISNKKCKYCDGKAVKNGMCYNCNYKYKLVQMLVKMGEPFRKRG